MDDTHRRTSSRRGLKRIAMAALLVMTILVILAGVALAPYNNSVRTAREAVLKTDLFQMREALDQYYSDKGKYPSSLDTLVNEKYMRAIPVDPFTKKSDTWQTVLSDPGPDNPSADIGVSDVKSGSDQTAIDNSRYSDW